MQRKISVIGLGYVGLPLAITFGQKSFVIGFDKNETRINELNDHIDRTNETTIQELKSAQISYTTDPKKLKEADFHIVAVPTPIDEAKRPNLQPLISASKMLAPQLKKGDIVVFESTVYPGATEEVCLPILEEISGLKSGKDFNIGYSPERINPGDTEHKLTNIKKIVSGDNENTLNEIANVYCEIIQAGVHRASSIKVAEAAKVIENTQRDLNIALMNELALIFKRLNINTQEVLDAAGTKWNFLPFKPGLVGGHCIGVDPYYLTFKAERVGYHPEVILAGRRINDSMGAYIAHETVKQLVKTGRTISNAKIAILGLTFKENCPDLRNSKVLDIFHEFSDYGIRPYIHDPLASKEEISQIYQTPISELKELKDLDAIVLAVNHQQYKEISLDNFAKMLKPDSLIMDIKSIFRAQDFNKTKLTLWSL